MAISLTTPISAQAFDKVWIPSVVLSGSPDTKTSVIAIFKPFNGETVLDKKMTMILSDIFALAESDAQFASAINTFMNELERQAKLRNII